MTYNIYCLFSKKCDTIFYVGVTSMTIEDRFRAHLSEPKPRNYYKHFILSLLGEDAGIRLLASTDKGKNHAYQLEREFITNLYNSGSPLCNGHGVRKGLKYILDLKELQRNIISEIDLS